MGIWRCPRFHALTRAVRTAATGKSNCRDPAEITVADQNWLKTLRAHEKECEEHVAILLKLFERNPGTACAEAQKLATGKR
jgi:hypothetical protein